MGACGICHGVQTIWTTPCSFSRFGVDLASVIQIRSVVVDAVSQQTASLLSSWNMSLKRMLCLLEVSNFAISHYDKFRVTDVRAFSKYTCPA